MPTAVYSRSPLGAELQVFPQTEGGGGLPQAPLTSRGRSARGRSEATVPSTLSSGSFGSVGCYGTTFISPEKVYKHPGGLIPVHSSQ